MNEIDSIVGTKETNKKSFDKDAWIKQKQEQRKFAYDTMDKTAEEIIQDISKFKTYLDIQGRFDKYSVGNALLITNQMPNATRLKEFDDWKEQGAFIKKNENGIIILEPGDQYTRSDGSFATSYNPKKMFDITQTTAKQSVLASLYDDRTKLTALLKECPVDIKAVDTIPNSNNVAEWNKDDNVLYVQRTDDIQRTFKEISTELARVSLEESGNTELDNFKCKCTAYMLCKKYDIDTSNFDINYIPEEFKNMSVSEIRNELSSMRTAMSDINARMNQHFESISKNQKNKDYER
ncbi:MAG: hypothetical protein E7313_04630 [Clostridiales bacterium]|nr:hypothetical protein [Clostridiales bacterium]